MKALWHKGQTDAAGPRPLTATAASRQPGPTVEASPQPSRACLVATRTGRGSATSGQWEEESKPRRAGLGGGGAWPPAADGRWHVGPPLLASAGCPAAAARLPPCPADVEPAVSGEWAAVTQREGALAACVAAAAVRGGASPLPAHPGLPLRGAEPGPSRPSPPRHACLAAFTGPGWRGEGALGLSLEAVQAAGARPFPGAVPAAAVGPPACARARLVRPRWARGGGEGGGAAWREAASHRPCRRGRGGPGRGRDGPRLSPSWSSGSYIRRARRSLAVGGCRYGPSQSGHGEGRCRRRLPRDSGAGGRAACLPLRSAPPCEPPRGKGV